MSTPSTVTDSELYHIYRARRRLIQAGILEASQSQRIANAAKTDFGALREFAAGFPITQPLTEMFYLQRLADHPELEIRRYIRDYCLLQVSSHRFLTAAGALSILSIPAATLTTWCRTGQIPFLQVMRQNYYDPASVRALRALLDRPGVLEVADQFQTSTYAIEQLALQGNLGAMRSPYGTWHFDPAEIDAHASKLQATLTLSAVLTELNMSLSTFKKWQRSGRFHLTPIRVGREYRYLAQGVRQLKHHLRHPPLNPGFEWLAQFIEQFPSASRWQYLGQVARRLGTNRQRVMIWVRQNLLPYAVRSPAGHHLKPEFPTLYIDGLLTYAGHQPINYQLLLRYRTSCQTNDFIVTSPSS